MLPVGIYLNPDNEKYLETTNGEIFVDKTLLIAYTNKIIKTPSKYICVSRPRRFGKSTDANMLVAYYSKGCDSSELFKDKKIASEPSYPLHLNKHHVIHLDMQSFLSMSESVEQMISLFSRLIIREIKKEFGDLDYFNDGSIPLTLNDVYAFTGKQFIFIIDEWDCIFREYKQDKEAQRKYLDYLRLLLKDKPYVELAYMTGILSIKKYGSHSALNMFDEISMIQSDFLSCFMGFTEEEVKNLCDQSGMDFKEMQEWYDGYHLNMKLKDEKGKIVNKEISIYSPRSVTASIARHNFGNYWNNTETYESLKTYIDMNYDGLKDTIIKLLVGEKSKIETGSFQNDMTTFQEKDDVLTLLVHLGYLGYNQKTKEVYIPNKEVTDSFIQSIRISNWQETTNALLNSYDLLKTTWEMQAEKVAAYIEEAHLHTSILQYNDENALSYTLSLAYYTARDDYSISRELPSDKGYADIVFIPKKDKPAMVIELKWNKEAHTAIDQIKEKKYMHGLEHYLDNLLLVGISYDKETKKHECIIEKYQ